MIHLRQLYTLSVGVAVTTVCLFAITACGSSSSSSSDVPQSESNPGNYSAVTITDAQIDFAIAKLDVIAKSAMERIGIPGMAIAVVHNDKMVYAKGFGVRQAGSIERVDERTVFQIASVSKSVGATVVAGVVGDTDNSISWDDPIVKYLPDIMLADPYVTQNVTIADMYSHRSGLPDHAGDLLESIGYGREYILGKLHHYPLEPFRTKHLYTNHGLSTAAEAVAKALSIPWKLLSKTRLYDQLGMDATSSSYVDFMAQENKALGSIKRDGAWIPTPAQRQPDPQSPAGGVSSNIVDMAKWMRMVLNGGTFEGKTIVDKNALMQALTPHSVKPVTALDARPVAYGLGFGVSVDSSGRVRYSHSGAFLLGASTAYTLLPSEQLGIIVLTNGSPYGVPESIVASFLDTLETGDEVFDWLDLFQNVFSAFYVNPSRLADQMPPENPLPALPYASYAGIYENELFGMAEIVLEYGRLKLRYGPKTQNFELMHWSGNTFSYEPVGEEALGISAIDFNLSGPQNVSSMTIEFLDEFDMGTFTRP